MPRRPSKHLRAARPLAVGRATAVDHADGRWVVRTVPGAAAVKAYRCPGCSQTISPGTPHVVVWPVELVRLVSTGVDERRHWHGSCWSRRR